VSFRTSYKAQKAKEQVTLRTLAKNNIFMQMYGEKVEEADELRMDLQDVKEMYKVQVKISMVFCFLVF